MLVLLNSNFVLFYAFQLDSWLAANFGPLVGTLVESEIEEKLGNVTAPITYTTFDQKSNGLAHGNVF